MSEQGHNVNNVPALGEGGMAGLAGGGEVPAADKRWRKQKQMHK